MAKDKSDDQSRKKETPTKASPSKIDIEIVHSNDPLSEQAQLDSPSHSEALPDAREVFGTKGWNSFSFKGKEFCKEALKEIEDLGHLENDAPKPKKKRKVTMKKKALRE
ncbi:hypothetical protein E6C27_scaffold67G00550 [Cucumis melo var. makuwa]|uniref:Uncharacterized protein n=1 Tax=Cucumis melo var. makuwa TaxID=1194695 RepID=A0A5A7TK20_CUCMM|nr:hypothetical protein E6C27_scaffold67G00550 [Cucumis melo var. makuwa]